METSIEQVAENLRDGVYDYNVWTKEDIEFLFSEIRRHEQRYNDLYTWMVKEFLPPAPQSIEECPF